jgi:serine protease Do
LGCHTENVTLEIAACLGLSEAKGVIITSVTAGSPAADAQLVAGDVLVSLDEATITDSAAMQQLMEAAVPGQRCQLTLIRRRRATTVEVSLGRLPDSEKPETARDEGPSERITSEHADVDFGLHLDNLSPEMARWLGYSDDVHGVLVSKVDRHSPAYNQGICAGMLILNVGDQATSNLHEYKASRGQAQFTTQMLVLVGSPEGNRHIILKPKAIRQLSSDGR